MVGDHEPPEIKTPRITRRRFMQAAMVVGLARVLGISTPARAQDLAPDVPSGQGGDGARTLSPASIGPSGANSAPSERSPHLKPVEEIRAELIPADELSEKYHIKILDLADQPNFVRYGFRRSGITQSPLFELQASLPYTLHYVLLNGPYISPEFLTPSQKEQLPPEAIEQLASSADRFLYIRRNDIQRDQRRKLRVYGDYKDSLDQDLQSGALNQDQYNVQVAELNFEYRDYLPGVTDSQLLERCRGVTITPAVDHTEHAYIFLPGRDTPDPVFESGPVRVEKRMAVDMKGQPKPYQSYIDPDVYFTIDVSDPQYPIHDGATPATVAMHETQHAMGIKHPYADLNLIENYRKAHAAYLNGDDSGYWMVWETPEGLTVSETQPSVAA